MTPWLEDTDLRLYVGDALEVLRRLPDGSVDCCVTSPPYWGLRDYGTGEWEGGDESCDHKRNETRAPHERRSSTLGGGTDTVRVQEEASAAFKDVCGKCGARRVDRQLGLEVTPDLFVQKMVEVFREVRRVLAPHGTCWVNLGDSYASVSGSGLQGENGQMATRTIAQVRDNKAAAAMGAPRRPPGVPSLKPKDLVGVPWRVARALQEPFYTGSITDERDRVWLAAMIDAEGCVYIHKRKAGQPNGQGYERKNDSYGSGLEISNTNRDVVERVLAIVGKGSISTSTRGRNQPLYRWNLRTNECRDVLREVYPHLVAKQHQARLAIGCPSSGSDAAKAHVSLIALHNGESATIDFAAPPSLYEPGWYLRSDIVWSKCNPMPESVTDRPTKAHEYVFLLSKQPRYWFDAEAVREPHTDKLGIERFGTNGGRSRDDYEANTQAWNGGGMVHKHRDYNPAGRNVRSVWEIATQPYPEAHFATFPEELPRRAIAAGCPLQVCRVCGKPRERIVEQRVNGQRHVSPKDANPNRNDGDPQSASWESSRLHSQYFDYERDTLGWSDCGHNSYRPGVTLDPFAGAGTTLLVARKLGRHSIGIELNPEYAELIARRTRQLSLLSEENAA